MVRHLLMILLTGLMVLEITAQNRVGTREINRVADTYFDIDGKFERSGVNDLKRSDSQFTGKKFYMFVAKDNPTTTTV